MAWTVEASEILYCPSCGNDFETEGRSSRRRCGRCGASVYRNPVPMGRATVVDGDRVLLVEHAAGEDRGEWALAGGHLEHEESPRAGAARELEEETGLVVPPSDLQLVGDGFLALDDGRTLVSFNYAAPAAVASGSLRARDDAAAARYWSLAELRSSPPQLRASGLDQVLTAIDRFGSP